MNDQLCRCGWNGDGDHLCHRCHINPGTKRFYMPSPRFSLAGMQMKFSVTDTVACDSCWTPFEMQLKEQNSL